MAADNNYYFNQLTKPQRQAYHAMLVGFQSLSASFSVPRMSSAEFADIFFYLRLDHPEIFYVVNFEYRFVTTAESVEFIPEYMFPPKQIKEHINAMEARVNKLIRPALGMDERDKEQYIHDFILENVRYDKLKKPYSHEIIGPLGHGVGVCEGISKTVKMLCDRLGIWCIIAISGNNPEKGIKYRHAWNVVKIGGEYYHLDATFDNSLSRGAEPRYDYFNINDAQLFRDHEPVLVPVPKCSDGRHGWYNEKKLCFNEIEKIRSRAAQALRKNKTLVFRYSGGYLTREIIMEILTVIAEEGNKKGKYPILSMNLPQSVFQLRYTDERPTEELRMENANEGEEV